jgi:hypothetical protein
MSTTKIARNYSIGSKFKLTADAVDNYGAKYADRTFTVTKWATHHGKPSECCGDNPSDPHGHPGFDGSAGSAIYDAAELPFSVYEWEMVRA